MRVAVLFAVAVGCLALASVRAEECQSSPDGDVGAWLKTLGCKISKGAGDLQDSAKPWVDKVGAAAKDFGSNAAQTFDELKQKLSSDGKPALTAASTGPVQHEPTEKVPLAPLDADKPSSIAAAFNSDAPVVGDPQAASKAAA